MLTTKQLSLRLITETDLEAIHKLQSIPEVDRYNTLGIPKGFDETKKVMIPLIEANQKKSPIITLLRLNKRKMERL